jgi:outer membrane protein OmpA-like peptidoglycan-associated protein
MADGYSWSELRDGGTYRLPGPEHLGWWAAVAMLVSILLHVGVFLALDRMKIALRFEQARELSTGSIHVRQVEVRPMEEQRPTPEEVVTPPKDASSLLEEVDLLNALPKDLEIDIKPDIREPEYALKMQNPALEGDPAALAMEISTGMEVDAELPELGREPERLKPAEIGQVTVDPGALKIDEETELGKFTDEFLKRGAGGTAQRGALDGIASLDDLLDLPPNILLASKTLLPSDLLFEFNSAELRESAKVGLMKLALLMDRNPNLFCWIEGHTDLVGGDEFNLNLSIRRAEAVKSYLVKSMHMDESKIIPRGFGRFEPLVIAGSVDEQAINRRVEIRMRKAPPEKGQLRIEPKKATVVDEAPPAPPPPAAKPVTEEPPPPKAVKVTPQRALPVEQPAPPPLRAQPVGEPPPRAEPVAQPPPPRAEPVDG